MSVHLIHIITVGFVARTNSYTSDFCFLVSLTVIRSSDTHITLEDECDLFTFSLLSSFFRCVYIYFSNLLNTHLVMIRVMEKMSASHFK